MIENNKKVILVDENDIPIGEMDKLEVHRRGLRHRAFSIFIFNSNGELLLQRRAMEKYHSPGLWTNTCCSHPEPWETTIESAHKRIQEEMGMSTVLYPLFDFSYTESFDNGLIENEFDHVFIGMTDEVPRPNRAEVSDWKYVNLTDLKKEMAKNPQEFTVWLKICFNQLLDELELQKHPLIDLYDAIEW